MVQSRDVSFVSYGKDSCVCAKLNARPDDETLGKGDGYVDTTMQLLHVSKKEKLVDNKVKEPEVYKNVQFLLSQAFLATQEKSETHIWEAMPLAIRSG